MFNYLIYIAIIISLFGCSENKIEKENTLMNFEVEYYNSLKKWKDFKDKIKKNKIDNISDGYFYSQTHHSWFGFVSKTVITVQDDTIMRYFQKLWMSYMPAAS